jgi:acetyl esterase/lipase
MARTILFFISVFLTLQANAQTTAFVDDFNRTTGVTPGGIPEMTYAVSGTGLSTIETAIFGTTLNTAPLLKIASASTAGRSAVIGSLATFSSPFNTTLSANSGLITWSFNSRHNRNSTLTGFDAAQWGFAVILAASSSDLSTANGYAVVSGGSGSNVYRLVKFTGGLYANAGITNLVTGMTQADRRDYMSMKVTYDPQTGTWSYYDRTDAPSSAAFWNDPSTGEYTLRGTSTDAAFTGIAMTSFGFFWNYNTTTGNNAYFDNFKVTVTPETSPPVATFVPSNGATLVLLSATPTITFNEPVRKTDASPLTNTDLFSLVSFKTSNASGTDVLFTATINASKTVITVTPVSVLSYDQQYYLAVGPVEDSLGNESGTQSSTFTTMANTVSNDASLSDLAVNGTTVAGFNSTLYGYSVEVPYGTAVVPTVTAVPAYGLATVVITPAAILPGMTTVLVTAQDGTTQHTYTVSFTIGPPSTDATLSNLRWLPAGGSQSVLVTGFNSVIMSYTVDIPVEVTGLTFVASPVSSTATMLIIPPANLTGTTVQRTGSVVVTAQDGVTVKTYSVLFNNASTLPFHFKEGFPVFPPSTWTFTGNISNSTANGVGLYSPILACPKFKWTAPTDGGSLITPACNTAGTLVFYVRVLDNNPASELHFYIEKSTNAGSTWTILATDPMPMTGSTVIWHQVTIPVNDNSPSILLRLRGSALTGTTATGLFYVDDVSLTMNPVADASLSDLKAGGTTIQGFSPGTHTYIVNLSPGTTIVPPLVATTAQPGATAVVTNATSLPGTSTVLVTAQNGVNTLTYTVNLSDSLASPSNLSAMQVPGGQVTLNWGDNNSNEDGYRIERKPTGGLFAHVGNVAANVTSKSNMVPGLDPNTFIPADRFPAVTVTSGVKFADVINYQGVPTSLYLDIYEPTGDTTHARPMIIWIHGGGFRTDSYRTQGYIVDYSTRFAKRGYVCMSIDYRLRDGASMPTQAAEFPALQDAARDANAAISWVKANAAAYHIDPNLIFIAGGSAGGRTTQTVCQFDGPDPTALYPPENQYLTTPWNKTGLIANATLWGGLEPEMRGWVYPYLQPTDIPTILVHGSSDVTIYPQESIDLYDTLVATGVTAELHIIPGATHSCLGHETEIAAWVAAFFAQEWNKVNALATSHTYRINTFNATGSSGYSNTAGWPMADNATPAGFTAKVNLNVPGTSWYVILPAGSPAPTAAQVKAGKNSAGVVLADSFKGAITSASGKTEYSSVITGLAGSTQYDLYFAAENAVQKLQTVPAKVTITTTAPSVPANTAVAGTVAQPACYNATATITVAGTPAEFVVENGGQATMIAGLNIRYLPGTKVLPGGTMWGYITPNGTYCGLKSTAMVENTEEETENPHAATESLFKIYPNPTTGIFTLELQQGQLEEGVKYECYGIFGERLFSGILSNKSGRICSLSNLPSGIYFIRVIAGDKTETTKIIKK